MLCLKKISMVILLAALPCTGAIADETQDSQKVFDSLVANIEQVKNDIDQYGLLRIKDGKEIKQKKKEVKDKVVKLQKKIKSALENKSDAVTPEERKTLKNKYYELVSRAGLVTAVEVGGVWDSDSPLIAEEEFFSLFIDEPGNLEIQDVNLMQDLCHAAGHTHDYNVLKFIEQAKAVSNQFQMRAFLEGIQHGFNVLSYFDQALQINSELQQKAFSIGMKVNFNTLSYFDLALRVSTEKQLKAFTDGARAGYNTIAYYRQALEEK